MNASAISTAANGHAEEANKAESTKPLDSLDLLFP